MHPLCWHYVTTNWSARRYGVITNYFYISDNLLKIIKATHTHSWKFRDLKNNVHRIDHHLQVLNIKTIGHHRIPKQLSVSFHTLQNVQTLAVSFEPRTVPFSSSNYIFRHCWNMEVFRDMSQKEQIFGPGKPLCMFTSSPTRVCGLLVLQWIATAVYVLGWSWNQFTCIKKFEFCSFSILLESFRKLLKISFSSVRFFLIVTGVLLSLFWLFIL